MTVGYPAGPAWPGAPPPPGVPLAAYPATAGKRIGAALLDVLIVGAGIFVGLIVVVSIFGPTRFDTGVRSPRLLLFAACYIAVLTFPWPLYFLIGWRRGATAGMSALNLHVRSATGGRPTGGQLLLRLAGAFWSTLLLFFGFFWAGIDKRKRTWHDMLSGTVVEERRRWTPYAYAPWQAWGPAPPPPPGAPAYPPVYQAPGQPGHVAYPPVYPGAYPPAYPGAYPPAYPAPYPPAYPGGYPPVWPPPGYGAAPGYAPPPPPPAAEPSAAPAPAETTATAESAPGVAVAAATDASVAPADPPARGWRNLTTWGRSPWTWTDVLPVIVLFIPLLQATTWLIRWVVTHLQPHPPQGQLRGVELLVLELLVYSGVLFLLFLLVTVRRHSGLRGLGLGRVSPRWLAAAPPALIGAYALVSVGGAVSQILFPGTPNNQCTSVRGEFADFPWVAIIVVAVAAPLVEETFFRGFLLRYLRDRLPRIAALALSAAIFSAAHFEWGQPTLFLPIFMIGFVLGTLYLYSGSIWPGVMVHGGYNLVSTLVLLFGVQHC